VLRGLHVDRRHRRFAEASATFTIAFLSQRVDFVSPISYGEHTATLDGHMSW